MKEWLMTFVETEHFPFYEFLWIGMLGLWWSVIARLKRIEERIDDCRQDTLDIINAIVEEES